MKTIKKKKFNKLLFGEIKFSFSRFISIFAIVALGVGFLAGLGATTPDMRESVDALYDEYDFHDIRIISTLGLTDGDIDALREVWSGEEGVVVEGAYSSDAIITTQSGDEYITRFLSLGSELNLGRLVEGRMPENPGECLAVLDDVKNYIVTGDTFTVNDREEDGDLVCGDFTVVGIIDVPMYMSIERDTTRLGSGKISQMMYLTPESFNISAYTDIYARFDNAEKLMTFGDAYAELLEELVEKAESVSDERSNARLDELTADGRKELADARDELEAERAKAEAEIADAEIELADAEAEIADAQKALADGEAELADGVAEYEAAVLELQDSELELADGERAYEEGAARLEDARLQLADGERELRDGRRQYEENLEAYNSGYAAYEAGLAEYNENLETYNAVYAEFEAGKNDYENGLAAYNAAYSEYTESRAALEAAAGVMPEEAYMQALAELEAAGELLSANKAELDAAGAVISATEEGLASAKAQLDGARLQLDGTAEQLEAAQIQLRDAERQLSAGEAELEDARRELEAGEAELAESRAQLDDGAEQLNSGRLELADAEKALEDGRAELEENRLKLADAQTKLEEGREELAEARLEAERELADAEAEIAEAEAELDSIEAPEWYILDRNSNMSYVSFESNAEKIGAIAKVFPIFFFLVAALVALTTMTRMVEEERGQIGTLKTLGYRDSAIMMKYVVYSGAASLCGSAAGLIIGFKLFPTVIWKAYDIMYILPELLTPFRWDSAPGIAGVAVLCTVGAAVAAVRATVCETPAVLMRPRSPKAGKRVFLENIAPLWRHMSFTHKVTARNLIRYKKRFFMTVIGIAGCTALLVTGFGLRDSISDIVNKQYNEIEPYNLTVRLGDGEFDEALESVLNDKDIISSYLPVQQRSIDIIKDGSLYAANLRVPGDAERFNDFVTTRVRKSGDEVVFGKDSVILTEKMAETLGVSAGDTIVVDDGDEKFELTLTGVCENYIYSYVYVAPDVYSEATGDIIEPNELLAFSNADDPEREAEISAKLLESELVSSAYFTADTGRTFSDMLSKIDYIIIVLIVSAGLLAVVVLYNLTNINITERTRELATIKVLGFYDGEVAAYIYRENVVLTLLGCAAGLLLGIALHIFVVKTAEVDMVMFGREIKAFSYIISVVMTLVFSAIVNIIMLKRLRNIDMVESMKAE